jgi:type 1 glutamine amidotransferase
MMKRNFLPFVAAAVVLGAAVFLSVPSRAQNKAGVKPLKALLVIGGCCHDYKAQKDILKAGIESRANVEVEVCFSADSSTKALFKCYEGKDWAKGYDVVIHDECSADIKDTAYVGNILDAHRNGVPAVNLHCAMHCYRVGQIAKPVTAGSTDAMWFDMLGLQSTGHGPQKPIEVAYVDAANPVTSGLANWTTINEELYNNIQVYPAAVPLAKGKQEKQETVVAWTHEYGEKKTRIFSTTLGHNNETVADDRYLNLVTRGLLWACGKIGADGKTAEGYGAAAK